MKQIWMSTGTTYSQTNPDFKSHLTLPVGVYAIDLTELGFKLNKLFDKFEFPFKVYGIQTDFINHVIKSYQNTTGNFGILLNGIKGTGKTVTAKEIANKLNLPVIIVKNMNNANSQMVEFLASIENDCIFFLDEFEKNFKEDDSTVLQIMDGVYNSEYRKFFLLTTNEINVNKNLLGRPSRIRYVLNFNNLNMDTINEIIEDTLEDKSKKNEILEFVDRLNIVSVDILKSIISEVNIHGSINKSKDFFNVQTSTYRYSCYYEYVYNDLELVKSHLDELITDFDKAVKIYKSKFNVSDSEYAGLEFGEPQYCVATTEKPVNKMKVGDVWRVSNHIVYIDSTRQIIVSTNEYEDIVNFYKVSDWNQEPSLLSKLFDTI